MDVERILKSMTNITPNQDQIDKIEKIRNAYKDIVLVLSKNCKDSRELSVSLTNLESSLMWAIKSIILED